MVTTKLLRERIYVVNHLNFTDGKNETLREEETYPKSHGLGRGRVGI